MLVNPGRGADPATAVTFELPLTGHTTDIEVADINKDGYKDLVLVVAGMGTVRTLLNPTSRYGADLDAHHAYIMWATQARTEENPPNMPRRVKIADMDKDGHLDLIVGTSTDTIIYFGSDGSTATGDFDDTPVAVGACGQLPPLYTAELEVADVDNDGW